MSIFSLNIVLYKMKYQVIMGAVLALLDTVSLPLFKTAYLTKNPFFLSLGIIIGVVQSLIFYNSMKYTTLTVLNVLWDLLSDIFVSIVGIVILGENVSPTKLLGIVLSFISIYLLNT